MSKKSIFVVNGYPGSGKTTFGNILGTFVSCKHLSIIDPIKKIAENVGWDSSKKTGDDRKFLSDLKDLCDSYNDYSFSELTSNVVECLKDDSIDVILIDIREPSDIDRAVKMFEAKTIYIDRGTRDKENIPLTNHADSNVEKYDYDYIICNHGTYEDFVITTHCFTKGVLKIG